MYERNQKIQIICIDRKFSGVLAWKLVLYTLVLYSPRFHKTRDNNHLPAAFIERIVIDSHKSVAIEVSSRILVTYTSNV